MTPEAPMGYQHLLVALDLSAESDRIVAKAAQLAGLFGARVSLLHVVEYVPLDLSDELLLSQQTEIDDTLLASAKQALEELAMRHAIDKSRCWVELGVTKAEIVRLAEEQQADLLVIGSHGRHGLALLLGSTVNSVLHNAPCDVLALRVQGLAD